jgi:uncharacterized protein (DUF4415 family)
VANETNQSTAQPPARPASRAVQARNARSRPGGEQKDKPPSSALEAQVGRIGKPRIEAGPAFTAASRMAVRGLNVRKGAVPGKEKISVTLDRALLEEIRQRFPGTALSSAINELLRDELANHRLGELVQDMERDAGPVPQEAYDRVLALWRAKE